MGLQAGGKSLLFSASLMEVHNQRMKGKFRKAAPELHFGGEQGSSGFS